MNKQVLLPKDIIDLTIKNQFSEFNTLMNDEHACICACKPE